MNPKAPYPGTPAAAPREAPGFELGLPMRVLGRDASGREFEERTTLGTMSHAAASFTLRSPVVRGADLKLVVSLPRKLSEADDLELVIRGRVTGLASEALGAPGLRVALKLESRYLIKPRPEDGASRGRERGS